ncbi:tectonic-1 isoform X1 [Oryzias melastigma]|uniref:Tectonic family member 1 n=1 Tax=Oryzias melastigma TaxID=30732 RepID=A0A3B3DX00_ORYME|nr:tectonic-1 isoform X1 [Oryzias melastigma]
MAALLFFLLDYFCFFLLIVSVNSKENSTSNYFNSTAWEDLNFTSETTFVASTEPTVFSSTTRSSSGTELPPLPAEPLPVSGRLPTPVTAVDSLCPCDELADVCDSNCCCDADCQQEVALFTSCSVTAVSDSKQLCSRDVASYALRTRVDGFSELLTSVQKETNYDVFCIQSYNHIDGLSLPPPALPTDRNFQSLFQQFSSFMFGPQSNDQELPAEVQSSPGYQFGDVLRTADLSGGRGVFYLPAAGVTAACVDQSPAAFLKDQQSRCSRRVILESDCSSLPALSVDSYSNILLLNGKNPDAAVLPVGVSSVVLQSTEGTQSELTVGTGDDLRPVLLSNGVCARVVLKVVYVIRYGATGELVNASVSLVLGFIRDASVLLQQDFRVTFVQDGGELALHFSGNPGYVVGLPLLSGSKTTEGISRSVELRDALSLLHGGEEEQDCLRGPHRRSPVLFGLNSVSGCSLRLEDTTNCSLVSQQLLEVLRGPNYPQYVASFGNSPLNNQLDWISVQSGFSPVGEQGCSVPLSLHLEIQWTKYGSLENPQAQIVSITEIIQTNSSSLPLLTAGGSSLPVRSSVAFIPVSADALPGYRATPTINAKLPFDFFFPFV